MDPVFLVGTERSGSNLLRLILDSHARIHIPHPPHVVRYFAPLEHLYGDLQDDTRFRRLVDDVLRLVHGHIHPWPWVPDAEDVLRRARTRDVFGVYVALHEASRDHVGKPRWGCKSTFMVAHLPRVVEAFPQARIVWLHRDPRDVACSAKDSVFSTFHPAYTAALWAEEQGLALAGERAGFPVYRLRYEDLVRTPEASVRALCAWIGEAFEPEMMRWFQGAEARRSASLSTSWRNTASPMRTEGLARWRQELAPADLRAVEAIAGPLMVELGYAPDATEEERARFHAGAGTRARWWLANQKRWLEVELASLREDHNVGTRWRRAALLAAIRWRRSLGA